MEFSLRGFIKGFKAGIPIALGVASYGLVFGILSRQAGLELLPSLCMSAFVFAGASQFVALDMWVTPLPVAAIITTTFVVNIRHFLMGAVLTGRFKGMTRFQKYLSLFFLVDETWAYSLSQWKKGNTNAALLAGSTGPDPMILPRTVDRDQARKRQNPEPARRAALVFPFLHSLRE